MLVDADAAEEEEEYYEEDDEKRAITYEVILFFIAKSYKLSLNLVKLYKIVNHLSLIT